MRNIIKIIFLIIIVTLINASCETPGYEDSDSNLLVSYQNSIDFCELLTKENEVSKVATRHSILYKDGINRDMYVFSIPIREIIDDQYVVIDKKLNMNDGKISTIATS